MDNMYFYPDDPDALFYVEFRQWGRRFAIFKRNFQPSLADPVWNPSGEVHPWNLFDGEVCEDDNAEYLFTEPYIMAIVDGLNLLAKHNNEFTKEKEVE